MTSIATIGRDRLAKPGLLACEFRPARQAVPRRAIAAPHELLTSHPLDGGGMDGDDQIRVSVPKVRLRKSRETPEQAAVASDGTRMRLWLRRGCGGCAPEGTFRWKRTGGGAG